MTSPAGRLAGTDEPSSDMIDAAIAWALRVHYNEPNGQTRLAFERWLGDDPRHAIAWSRMQAITGELRGLPGGLVHGTLQPRSARQAPARRRALKYLSLAGTLGMTGWLAGQHTPWQRLVADVSTGRGERRTITLADGTTVALNTDTAISDLSTGLTRALRLHRGEIFVSTGSRAQAPLRVLTGLGTLLAMHTRFLARLDDGLLRLAVQQGSVEWWPLQGPSRLIGAGERWHVRADGAQPAGPAGYEPAGWLSGVLVARDMPLGALLAELNRYRSGYLSAGADIEHHPITGVYQLGDIDQTLRFLAQTHGWRMAYRSRYWVSLTA